MEVVECKKTKHSDANATQDQISGLSEDIIGHILSFLPTKYAVATSILSRRWRYLWTNITNLDFGYCNPRADNGSFHNFVDSVLYQCTSKQFQTFRLTTYKADFDQVESWVGEVIRRNVYELELRLSWFPSCMSTCKALTVLKLYARKFSELEIPTNCYFPSLRILNIEFLCPSNILTETLCRSCPVLEDLTVKTTGVGEDSNFIICAPLLKRLKFYSNLRKTSIGKFVIDAPNLEYMDIYEKLMTDYVVGNLSSMTEAYVHVGDIHYILDEETLASRALELLTGLVSVKYLSVGFCTMQALDYASPHHLPVYHKMIRLELTIGVRDGQNDGRKILPRLLEVSPKLKVLILSMNRSYLTPYCPEGLTGFSDWSEPQSLPACLSSSLELVQINMFIGSEYDLAVVEYILMHAACLKKLTLKPVKLSGVTKVKFCQKLLEYPRSSRTCQVSLLD